MRGLGSHSTLGRIRGVVPRLERLDSSGIPQERLLSQPRLVLGRRKDADWSCGDQPVSRRHAAIQHSGDHDEIEDLGSMVATTEDPPAAAEGLLEQGDRPSQVPSGLVGDATRLHVGRDRGTRD